MSASHSPDISDIHHPTSIAETLSVTTEPGPGLPQQPGLPVNVSGAEAVSQSAIPSVGASISVPGDSHHVGERSSTSLLSLASNTLNLSDILTAQQQALEQFQCQLQLAQQTEAINQRLDAIERTLNNLIQQKAQEDAAKKQQQQQQQQQAVVAAALPQSPSVRPSQQIQLTTPEISPGDLGDMRRKKLPRELCSKVRSTYHSLNLDFKIDERFLSPTNQRVTDTLIDQVFTDTGGLYTARDIKRAAHRYYESRRRLGIEELPDRQEKAAEQRKRRKYRARQQRAYDRRRKFVRESEMRYWEHITAGCMTEESDSENGEKIVTHQLLWRSEFLNQFIMKLDNRCERNKKPGQTSTVKRERVAGLPSTTTPPHGLPSWMIDPNYKLPPNATLSLSMDGTNEDGDGVAADVTTYSSLITEVQDVHDDSSDFELPNAVA